MSEKSSGRFVVIGGDAAGMSAASQAKRRYPGLEVVVLEKDRYISYAACGMPYMVSGVVADAEDLFALRIEDARGKRGLDVRLGQEATAIDPAAKTVRYRDVSTGKEETLSYDACMIATGAVPVIPPIPGVGYEGVLTLRSYGSGLVVRKFVDEHKPKSAVVVGAGLVGLEMAEALTLRDVKTTVMEMAAGPILGLAPELSRVVEEEMASHGVTLLMQTALERIDGPDGRVAEVQGGSETIPAELVLLSVGVRPASDLAADAGIELGVHGAIRVDEKTATSAQAVFSAGDCAEQVHGITNEPVFIPQALSANRQGRVAGANAAALIVGKPMSETNPPAYGTIITKVFDTEIALTGLTLQQALDHGLDAAVTVIKSRSKAHYYPGADPLHVALVFEKGTGRLLGGQLVGKGGAVKRIDVLVTALSAGFDLDRLSRLDLAYAPPFAPVWDPILVAANVAKKKV